MTKKSHNKKRNVGIIYEQLLSMAAQGLVESNPLKINKARKIIKKYFQPGTELYKEHRLFKALAEPHIKDGSLATNILVEAKKAARNHADHRLEREKSRLIKEINYNFGKTFYQKRVKNYTDFATIQTLLNDWRAYGKADLARVSLYESKVHSILTKPKEQAGLQEERDSDINGLVVRIMTEKFNKKYSNQLTDVQKELIKQYVFYDNGKGAGFTSVLENIREQAVRDIDRYAINCENAHVSKKISKVREDIRSIDINILNDHTMSRFLTLCALSEELRRDDNE
tara:strand:- start:236 stop:1087 length:852 start_codon:yes stop_codon:yes gene_type:complete